MSTSWITIISIASVLAYWAMGTLTVIPWSKWIDEKSFKKDSPQAFWVTFAWPLIWAGAVLIGGLGLVWVIFAGPMALSAKISQKVAPGKDSE